MIFRKIQNTKYKIQNTYKKRRNGVLLFLYSTSSEQLHTINRLEHTHILHVVSCCKNNLVLIFIDYAFVSITISV
jgi:hypothetical protein